MDNKECQDFLKGLIGKLRKLQSTIPSKDESLIASARLAVKEHIKPFDRFVDFLRKQQANYGCYTEYAFNAIDNVAGALRDFGRPYGGLIDSLSHKAFIEECERWIREIAKQRRPGDENDFWCNKDYSEVKWNEQAFTFNKSQAKCIAYLHENGSAFEASLGEHLESAADDFRLIQVFRNKKAGGYHPAWGTFVITKRKGVFTLNLDEEISIKK